MKTVWYGGTIYTMQREGETVEAVLVENDKIIAVGRYDELKLLADAEQHLEGATMLPGLVDSHLHMIMHGRKMLNLDLSEAKSADDMLARIKEAASKLDGEQWLLGEGWNENAFADKQLPTLAQLDALYDGPIALQRICHHVLYVNTKGMALAGITANTAAPSGGQIGYIDGALNGLFYETATQLFAHCWPTEGEAYIQTLEQELQVTVDTMLSMGLTGGHTEEMFYFGDYKNPLTAYNRVVGEKQNFRVNLLRHHEVFAQMMAEQPTYAAPYVTPGAMKIFADGSFGGATAAVLQPYVDQPHNKGLLIHSNEEMEALVQLAREHNEAIAVHMIGDAAAEQVISAIEKYPAPAGKRDRLIHLCLMTEAQLARIQKLPVIVDVQPPFVPSDFPWIAERLGEARLQYAYAWKTLLQSNVLCAGGTDAPIEQIDPLVSIYTAVERKWPHDTHAGYLPEQKLSLFEAVSLYTIGSAQATNQEHEFGYIAPNYYADFSIFDRDILQSTDQLLAAKAMKTVVAGRIVFERAPITQGE